MATIASATTFGDGQVITWTPLTETNADGLPARYVGSGDRVFQALGTFGSGGTIVLQGSLDGTNWATLRDSNNDAISLTAAGIRTVVDAPTWVRPFISAGTGVSLTAKLFIRTGKGK